MIDGGVLLTTAALVLPAELPDKTFVATLVLATRHRPAPVLVGVGGAFAVQAAIAATAGRFLGLLPTAAVLAVCAVLFAVGAVLVLRSRAPSEEEVAARDRPGRGWRTAVLAFGVLFAAEWGDASQLLTAALTARYDDPLSVGLGAWLALITVATLAALGGRALLRVVPLHRLRLVAAVLLGGLAVLSAVEAVRA